MGLVTCEHLSRLDLRRSPIPDPHGFGERAVAFIRALRHPKSTEPDKAFRLDPWQERIIRRVYGDTDAAGRRRIKTVFLLTGKGARKTTLMGAMGALHLMAPEFRTESGSIIAAAVDKEQASLAFEEAAGIIRAHRKTNAPVSSGRPRDPSCIRKAAAKFEAVSSDAGGKHGLSPNLLLVDEVAVWKTATYGRRCARLWPRRPARSPASPPTRAPAASRSVGSLPSTRGASLMARSRTRRSCQSCSRIRPMRTGATKLSGLAPTQAVARLSRY